ncbi:MAG TPA: 8-amino-7-oxononanoate synthase [Chthoniobacterales bacterium]
MGVAFDAALAAALAAWDEQGLRRRAAVGEAVDAVHLEVNGRAYVNFSSNDYLGLALHPQVCRAAHAAIDRYGVGAGASRLVTGSRPSHRELEERLSAWKRTSRAVTFSSGYAAALGTIPALVGPADVVIIDKLSHACLIDAARLSGARLRTFPHNRLDRLETLLQWAARQVPKPRALIVTEAVFSMDGDQADLPALVELKDRYGAALLVDEAHAAGLFGPEGAGLVSLHGLEGQVEVQMGTLSKALGVSGGYIAGSENLVDHLIQRARAYVFSTAPPPAIAAAAQAAIEIAVSAEGAQRRNQLWANASQLARALNQDASAPPASAIFPVVVGGEQLALAASERLREAGMWVPAIRYPTVARGTARLRITLSSVHAPDEVAALAEALRAGQVKG